MKLTAKKDFKSSYLGPLLRKIYPRIKEIQKRYKHESEDVILMMIKNDLIFFIEDFLIRNNNIEYIYTKNFNIPVSSKEDKYKSWSNREYFKLAIDIRDNLEEHIKKFIEINSSKEKYKDTNYTDEEKSTFMLNSVYIVSEEAQKIQDKFPDLYSEVMVYIERFKQQVCAIDTNQNKRSQFLSYKEVLLKSKLNYVIKGKYGLIFYPVITDILLDYLSIMVSLLIIECDLKKTNRRYNEYREKLSLGFFDEIDPLYVYTVQFSKKERKNNIKRYILYFYLELFDHNENINVLFRKLFLNDLDNNSKSFKPEVMQKYMPKIHQIFNIAVNIRLFL